MTRSWTPSSPAEDEEVLQPEEKRVPLNMQRHEAVYQALLELGAKSVIDLGCGPGQFLDRLVKTPAFTRVAGSDVSTRSLQHAARRLRVDRMSERQAERVELFQSAVTYEDARFAGFDAAVLMEVVEHVDPARLEALERVVFGAAKPGGVVVTTPNAEYNALYEGLVGMRHPDHRFEWTREEFAGWVDRVASTYGDRVEKRGVLRRRHLGKKRQLAQREHGLGLEALTAFVDHEPLWKVHQSVFAVLALESEPVDPRL